MTDVTKALRKWQFLQPRDRESCCPRAHWSVTNLQDYFIADDRVCARELAWRQYVRLRDFKPNWPFVGENND